MYRNRIPVIPIVTSQESHHILMVQLSSNNHISIIRKSVSLVFNYCLTLRSIGGRNARLRLSKVCACKLLYNRQYQPPTYISRQIERVCASKLLSLATIGSYS